MTTRSLLAFALLFAFIAGFASAPARAAGDFQACKDLANKNIVNLAIDSVGVNKAVEDSVSKLLNLSEQQNNYEIFFEREQVALDADHGLTNTSSSSWIESELWCFRVTTEWKTKYPPDDAPPYNKLANAQVGLVFDVFQLPTGGEVRIYGKSGNRVATYTDADNGNSLATGLLAKSRLTIAYREPQGASRSNVLHISKVVNRFANPESFGASADCHLNASVQPSCEYSAPWSNEIRASVQTIKVNPWGDQSARCSATLLNRVSEDLKPLILTGHCIVGAGGYLNFDETLRKGGNLEYFFRFDYRSDYCGTGEPSQEPSYWMVRGANTILRANGYADGGGSFNRTTEANPSVRRSILCRMVQNR